MSDPAAELKGIVKELRAISAVLDATPTPELVRPIVPYKQVTEELVYWTIRIYAYSILCQFREMLRSALSSYDADQVPPVFLCARAMWEMAAHAYYVKKHCFQYMDKKDWQATWDLMLGINQGSRHMKEKQHKAKAADKANKKIKNGFDCKDCDASFATASEFTDHIRVCPVNPLRNAAGAAAATAALEIPEGPHIAKVMACFNEYFRSEEDKNPTQATENYSYLSEFCHPNSFAFTNHIDMDKAGADCGEVKVVFLKPDKQASIQVMPDMFYACMPLLFSMDELLQRIGDKGFSKAAYEYGRIAGPAEPASSSV